MRLRENSINGKKSVFEKFNLTDIGFSDFGYIPPKPKYSIHEVNKMAIKEGMSYGKFVGLMHEKGIKL